MCTCHMGWLHPLGIISSDRMHMTPLMVPAHTAIPDIMVGAVGHCSMAVSLHMITACCTAMVR